MAISESNFQCLVLWYLYLDSVRPRPLVGFFRNPYSIVHIHRRNRAEITCRRSYIYENIKTSKRTYYAHRGSIYRMRIRDDIRYENYFCTSRRNNTPWNTVPENDTFLKQCVCFIQSVLDMSIAACYKLQSTKVLFNVLLELPLNSDVDFLDCVVHCQLLKPGWPEMFDFLRDLWSTVVAYRVLRNIYPYVYIRKQALVTFEHVVPFDS